MSQRMMPFMPLTSISLTGNAKAGEAFPFGMQATKKAGAPRPFPLRRSICQYIRGQRLEREACPQVRRSRRQLNRQFVDADVGIPQSDCKSDPIF
ncbi:hypothetical protein I6F07_21300 [Ensifer sp. IC4062]|nr:hypothetical protein [Ensifer sp. IC4062]MCA1442709.1 hypothetical protein [Ensifer sp. IC4062]